MQEFELPSPGIGGKGHHLRRIAANAISQLQISGPQYTSGKHPQAAALQAFFDACSTAAALLKQVASTGTFTPTAKSFTVAAGPTAGPVLARQGTGVPVYTSATPAKATVNAATGVITAVSVGTSVITATWPADPDYLGGSQTYVATVTA